MRIVMLSAAVLAVFAGPAAAKDFDVRAYGAKGDGKADDTAAVQAAIDAATAEGGGRVVLEGGVFWVKPIYLKDNVDFHIARNARLLGSGDWRDYPARGNLRHVVSERMPRDRDSALITADEATGVSLTGEGVIDGNGTCFVEYVPGSEHRKWQYQRIGFNKLSPPRVVLFAGCRDVTVKDLTMTNQPSNWAYMVHDCDNVIFDRVKVFSNVRYPNNDGLHFNSCRDVSVSNCRVEAGDDALVVRAQNRSFRDGRTRPAERITVTNCRLRGYTDGIRLGWCRDGVIRDVTFSNIVIHDSLRGINMWFFDGDDRGDYGIERTRVENIIFSNIVMDRIHTYPMTVVVGEDSKWCEAVRNITFANITARSLAMPEFIGSKTCPLENFLFTGCRFIRSEDPDVRPPWLAEPEARVRDKTPSVMSQGFLWGRGGQHANGGNPFFNCRGFTFNACTFDDL